MYVVGFLHSFRKAVVDASLRFYLTMLGDAHSSFVMQSQII